MLKNGFLTFLVKKSIWFIMKTYSFFRGRIKSKKNCVLDFNKSQLLKPYVCIKRIERGKNSDKDKKSLVEKMNNAGRTMEKLKYRICVKLVMDRKNHLQWKSKPK